MSQKIVVGDRVELVNSGTLHRSGVVVSTSAVYCDVEVGAEEIWKIHRLNLERSLHVGN
jgi:hypothetical protein